MTDYLFFKGFQIDCIIGLAEWERMVRQTVSIDLKLECDLRGPARHDQLKAEHLNTKALSKRLQSFVADTEFALLETLAERTCEMLLREFPVSRVRLRLQKPGAIRGARTVGVVFQRTLADYEH